MKIYLFRHAEKLHHFHPNPGLSERGSQQALLLAEKVQQSELPRPTHLWSSPKKRAQQSFAPLSLQFEIPLHTVADLDEKNGSETMIEFRLRIESTFKTIIQKALTEEERKNNVIYLCSHSDWLEEALPLIPSENDLKRYFQWSPLQYLGLCYKNTHFEFIEHKRIPL